MGRLYAALKGARTGFYWSVGVMVVVYGIVQVSIFLYEMYGKEGLTIIAIVVCVSLACGYVAWDDYKPPPNN